MSNNDNTAGIFLLASGFFFLVIMTLISTSPARKNTTGTSPVNTATIVAVDSDDDCDDHADDCPRCMMNPMRQLNPLNQLQDEVDPFGMFDSGDDDGW